MQKRPAVHGRSALSISKLQGYPGSLDSQLLPLGWGRDSTALLYDAVLRFKHISHPTNIQIPIPFHTASLEPWTHTLLSLRSGASQPSLGCAMIQAGFPNSPVSLLVPNPRNLSLWLDALLYILQTVCPVSLSWSHPSTEFYHVKEVTTWLTPEPTA